MKAHAKNNHSRHLSTVKIDLHDDLNKIKDALTEAREHVKDKAGQMINKSYDKIKDTSLDIKDNAAYYIAKKPFKTIGIALLSGMAIGFLLRK